jgi:uncharacterized protein
VRLSRRVTVIVKVTNACDMQCKYCFIEPSVFHKTMSDETALRVVHAFLDSPWFESVNFAWHGGEPLLKSPEFFRRIFDEQRACSGPVAYTNSTQTNATHLDERMLELLLANDVSIGLSLDGTQGQTAASRIGRRTRALTVRQSTPGARAADAHATTVDAARRLQKRGRRAAAIVTVNRNNVDHPEEVYREFRDRHIDMQVNPLTRAGLADTSLGADLGVGAEEYGVFLVRLFDAWFDDPDRPIHIEPFGQHVGRILGEEVQHSCFYTLSCHHFFLGISPDGDLFPCGMFQGEPSFRYGNIHKLNPEQVAETALFGQIEKRERRTLQTCSRCAFFDLCYSGCMFHSLKDARLLAEKDFYCAGYTMYFEHALRRVHANLRAALSVTTGPQS